MKKIIVQWFATPNDPNYKQTLYVIESDHPRFSKKSRFDFGFMNVANRQGFTVEVRPLDSEVQPIFAGK